MADGFKGMVADINEAVVKPVSDEVGRALEQGVQSVVKGPGQNATQNSTPQPNSQQIKQEEQIKLVETRRKLDFWKNLSDAQNKVRAEVKQKDEERLKVDEKKKEIKQFEVEKKKRSLSAAVREAQTKTEAKKGVGG